MKYLELSNICKKYSENDEYSVENFNIEIEQGEFIVFVGPSGCGKSTTLRMIAGLEEITEGELKLEGELLNLVHPKDRDMAMVFQNYALYPHMDVRRNISFGLKLRKLPEEEIEEKVKWASEVLGLEELLDRKPKDLSGGQRQRVALGRAIVRNPKVFLMDEPLSNLDAKLRVHMRSEITNLHNKLNATTIYVTHDQVEAMTMADRIVCMSKGLVQQIGTPIELYRRPANVYVAKFIGAPQMNILNAKIEGENLNIDGLGSIIIPEGVLKQIEHYKGKEVILGIRPENMRVDSLSLTTYSDLVMTANVSTVEQMGGEVYIYSEVNGQRVIIKSIYHVDNIPTETIDFVLDLNKAHFFDAETESRIN